jgi:1,4-dihydroxy-6-naphthoate synthase
LIPLSKKVWRWHILILLSQKSYILENAQEKDEKVVQSHIDLYVNNYSLDLGDKGKKAIEFLLEKALSLNLLKIKREESLFI